MRAGVSKCALVHVVSFRNSHFEMSVGACGLMGSRLFAGQGLPSQGCKLLEGVCGRKHDLVNQDRVGEHDCRATQPCLPACMHGDVKTQDRRHTQGRGVKV